MNLQRLQLIAKAVKLVQSEKKSFEGLERQAIQLADQEYATNNKKVVDNIAELDFN